jgi:uncharacterized phage protein (TIGR02220 family)
MDIPTENFKGLLDYFKDASFTRKNKKEVTQADIDFCVAVLTYLNEQAGTTFRTYYPSEHTKLILERKNEADASMEDFKAVIDKCVLKWKGTDYEMYLRPSTLFSKKKFVNYLGERVNGKTGQPAPSRFGQFRDAVGAAKR